MRRLHLVTDATGEGTRVYDDEIGQYCEARITIEPTLGLGDVPVKIIITEIRFPNSQNYATEAEPKGCRNCRWWTDKGIPCGEGGCELDRTRRGAIPAHPQSGALAYKERGDVVLVTAPDSYCNQHFPREG